MDKYCYHGLLWFGQREDVKIFDSDTGEELLEHTLSERVDEIELPVIRANGSYTSAPSVGNYINVGCGFEPKGVVIQSTYPAWIIYTYGYTPIRIGGSTAGYVLDEDSFYPDAILTLPSGFKGRTVTNAWGNRTVYYGAAKELKTFTTPANLNESVQINLGFKPKVVAVRLTSSTMYVWLYMEDQPTYKYLVGEVNTYTDQSRNPITITNNGFTFTPKNSNQQNKEVVYFAA